MLVAESEFWSAVVLRLADPPIDDAVGLLRDVLFVGDRYAPIFAQDILHVGARGYGWLYSASAVGAVAGSLAMVPLAHRIRRRGRTVIWAVAGYGLATVVFGLSRSFWLTFVCLAWAGASDAVSMVIRNLVRQLETPDALRGRAIGISMMFFMGGPQLGELEAGLATGPARHSQS